MFAIAARFNKQLTVGDVRSAYLNAENKQGIKMKITSDIADYIIQERPTWDEYRTPSGDLFVELQKALYGLKDSGKLWNDMLTKKLLAMELRQSRWDPCLFTSSKRKEGLPVLTVLTNVDDLLIMSDNQAIADEFIAYLERDYGNMEIQRGDHLSYLGTTIERSSAGIKITCTGYEEKILEKYKVSDFADTPAPSNFSMKTLRETEKNNHTCDQTEYLGVVMSLMYLALRTRPDILSTVEALTTACRNPTRQAMAVAQRTLRYINKTKGLGIFYSSKVSNCVLRNYTDASYNSHADAKSHGGSITFLYGGAVDYTSFKQKCVSRSAFEAELISLDQSLARLLILQLILQEIAPEAEVPQVFEDNTAAILAVSDGVKTSMRSTMNVRLEWIKEHLKNKEFKISWVETENMIADGLTKILHGIEFERSAATMLSIN